MSKFLPPAGVKDAEGNTRTLSRASASVPARLPSAVIGSFAETLIVDDLEGEEAETICSPTSSSVRHTCSPSSVSTSLPGSCRPGTGRFSPEEMACFRKVHTPSRQCHGKAQMYWQTTGRLKRELTDNCWHSLPVLKGHFYSQDRLPDQHHQQPTVTKSKTKLPRRYEPAVVSLTDETLTSYVLDEIFPKSPSRQLVKMGSVYSGSSTDGETSSPEAWRKMTDQHGKTIKRFTGYPGTAACTGASNSGTLAGSSSFMPNLSGTLSSQSFGTASSSKSAGIASQGAASHSSVSPGKSAAASQGNGAGSSSFIERNGARSLTPLVDFRGVLLEKYGTTEEALDAFASEMPSSKMMTKKEFRRILQTRMGLDMPKDLREHVFSLLDLGGDGMIDLVEFRVALNATAPIRLITDLRRRWLAAGFKCMMDAFDAMTDNAVGFGQRLTLREFGEALCRSHVTDPREHAVLFNIIADPSAPKAKVSVAELSSAVATVSPHLLLEELRHRLVQKYGPQAHDHHHRVTHADASAPYHDPQQGRPFKRAWTDLEQYGPDLPITHSKRFGFRHDDFIKLGVRRLGLTHPEAVKLFYIMDPEGCGVVTREHFVSCLSLSDPSLYLEDLRLKIRQRFRSIDDVSYELGEFQDKARLPRHDLRSLQDLFGKLDLSEAETETLFELIDVDRVGTLLVDEFVIGTRFFAPGCAFEDLRVHCLQRHSQGIRSFFVTEASKKLRKWRDVETSDRPLFEVAFLSIQRFEKLLEELGLDSGLDLRMMFDLLDVRSEGTIALGTLISLLQAGGAGANIKLEEEALQVKAKQDIRSYTIHGHRLAGDLMTETREGINFQDVSKGPSQCSRVQARDNRRSVDAPDVQRPAAAQHHMVAPRLRTVPYDDIKGAALQQATLGPSKLGPHSRPGDFKQVTEKSLHDPHTSFNTMWKNLQSCPRLDERPDMEKSLQGYYQNAVWSLSGDLPLLECPPSRLELHNEAKTHRHALESQIKRNILRVV